MWHHGGNPSGERRVREENGDVGARSETAADIDSQSLAPELRPKRHAIAELRADLIMVEMKQLVRRECLELSFAAAAKPRDHVDTKAEDSPPAHVEYAA